MTILFSPCHPVSHFQFALGICTDNSYMSNWKSGLFYLVVNKRVHMMLKFVHFLSAFF